MLILISTLVLWISNTEFIFGQIWTEELKVVQFGWKLAHRVPGRCWFIFWNYFSQFWNLNLFLDKFWQKNSKLFIFTENWHTWYEDADSYSYNSFLNCQPKIRFWANLYWKSQSCLFCLKTSTHAHTHTVSRRCWFSFRY